MKRIRTLAGLRQAAIRKRAVTVPKSYWCRGPLPAAFVINLQGGVIDHLFRSGMYIYEKDKK